LIGVPRPNFCEPIARVLQMLGVRRGMVVSGTVENGDGQAATHLDELSILGETFVAEFYQEHGFSCSTIPPNHFSTESTSLKDLAGGDSKANAQIIRQIFSGKERGPKRDAVMLNAAAALLVSGKVKNLSEGWDISSDLIQ